MHNCVVATDSTLERVLGNTLRKSLFRSGLIRNKVVMLTVVNSVLQRGTNIRDSDDTGEGAAPLALALRARRRVPMQRTLLAQALHDGSWFWVQSRRRRHAVDDKCRVDRWRRRDVLHDGSRCCQGRLCAIILSVFTCQTCFYPWISRSCFSISFHVVR